ncbi:MAG: DUF3817 domain-containing protein [Bdellovibrionales bacterium]
MHYFRILSVIEGLSLLLLLFIAMPIKYIGGDPSFVKLVGPIHGFLFIVFVAAVLWMADKKDWPLKFTLQVIASSSIPFGMIWLERKLKNS